MKELAIFYTETEVKKNALSCIGLCVEYLRKSRDSNTTSKQNAYFRLAITQFGAASVWDEMYRDMTGSDLEDVDDTFNKMSDEYFNEIKRKGW